MERPCTGELQPLKTTLFEFRGSISVVEPQNFAMIRQQVFIDGAYRTATEHDIRESVAPVALRSQLL